MQIYTDSEHARFYLGLLCAQCCGAGTDQQCDVGWSWIVFSQTELLYKRRLLSAALRWQVVGVRCYDISSLRAVRWTLRLPEGGWAVELRSLWQSEREKEASRAGLGEEDVWSQHTESSVTQKTRQGHWKLLSGIIKSRSYTICRNILRRCLSLKLHWAHCVFLCSTWSKNVFSTYNTPSVLQLTSPAWPRPLACSYTPLSIRLWFTVCSDTCGTRRDVHTATQTLSQVVIQTFRQAGSAPLPPLFTLASGRFSCFKPLEINDY